MKKLFQTFTIKHLFIHGFHIFIKSRPWHQKPFVTLEEVSYFFDQNSVLKVSRILIVKAADFDFFYLNGHTVSGFDLDFQKIVIL